MVGKSYPEKSLNLPNLLFEREQKRQNSSETLHIDIETQRLFAKFEYAENICISILYTTLSSLTSSHAE